MVCCQEKGPTVPSMCRVPLAPGLIFTKMLSGPRLPHTVLPPSGSRVTLSLMPFQPNFPSISEWMPLLGSPGIRLWLYSTVPALPLMFSLPSSVFLEV